MAHSIGASESQGTYTAVTLCVSKKKAGWLEQRILGESGETGKDMTALR